MDPKNAEDPKSIYGAFWDDFVKTWPDRNERRGGTHTWPGDEWGNPQKWAEVFERLFVRAGVESWQRAVEIGPGSGKYTLKVLQVSAAQVRAYDVSTAYLEVCRTRCQAQIDERRLSLHPIDIKAPNQMLADMEAIGWRRQVDAVYSIAAMVHVDLQYVIVYMLNAALALKPGGKLLLTLADATSPFGFVQLLKDICWAYPAQANPRGSAKFEWLSPDLVRHVLDRLGFVVDWLNNDQRDILLVASLAKPELAAGLEQYILPRQSAR